MQLREIDKWTLERRKEEERGGSYLHTHEEVLGSGESRDKHVTTPTTVLRVGACVSWCGPRAFL
jgi:hypothetical protein